MLVYGLESAKVIKSWITWGILVPGGVEESPLPSSLGVIPFLENQSGFLMSDFIC